MAIETGDDFAGTERFEVVRRLGAGGMGVVYEAVDRERNTVVALKTLRTLKPDALLRFKQEFRALSDIQHRNLVGLGELFEDHERWFFTMEMVHGIHFLDYLRRTDEPDSATRPATLGSASGSGSGSSAEHATVEILSDESAPRGEGERRTRLSSGADEARVRSAFAQLALGLDALHRAQKVHRDIKPSNIMVTPEGRVIVLDFGLVADLLNMVPEHHLVGTFSYMAPEQAGLKAVGPAADWYSFGVLLYQALTGRLPVTGAAREVLVLKQAFEPAAPHVLGDVPEDLDDLCMRLLRIAPAGRPGGAEILRLLHAEETEYVASAKGHATHFVGRGTELDALREALAATRRGPGEAGGEGVTVFVHGESGVGKSALIRRFTAGVVADDPTAVILAGRCYERESVPYKAVDGIIDALSRALTALPEHEMMDVLPRQRGLIGQVFPVMRRIEAVAQAPRPAPGALDPQVLRARLFFALRDLFTRLADRRSVVLAIDDLQWADADSLALLSDVMRSPGAPRVLLVTTLRAALAGEHQAAAAKGEQVELRTLEELAATFSAGVRRLAIEALSPDEARRLVDALLKDAGAGAEVNAAAVAAEAGGHPLFIDELVRHKLFLGVEAGPLRLTEALRARITRLDAGARELLELTVVAGLPLVQEVAAAAARIDFGELNRRVAVLRAGNLARTAGARRTDTLEPYHDRVREAVLLGLDADAERDAHGRLAHALEASQSADPEALAEHWRGAGDADKAATYAIWAASQAADALAFDRAARLYQLGLDLKPPRGADATRLRTALGDALANAGRGAESAPVYLEAARSAAPAEALTLRRRGAEELLKSGRIDEALAELGSVLDAVDLSLPETPQRALAAMLYRRARVRLRGLSFQPREASTIAPEVLQRIDICWSVAPVLSMIDIIRGSDINARCLLMALETGEPHRIARAMAAETGAAAVDGGRGSERTARLLAAAVAAAKGLDDPYTLGWLELADILSAYLEGRFRATYDACLRAEKIFSQCVGAWWERATVELYAMLSLFWLGDLPEQRRRVDRCLRKGKERGDLSAIVNACTGFNLVPWLAADDPAGARRAVDEAMDRWSKRGFLLAHYWELLGRAQIAIYEGDGAGAQALLAERWPALSRSLLLRVQIISVESLFVRGRAALTSASRRPPGSRERERLARDAERDARELEGEKMAYATPLAWLLRGGALTLRGERADAARLMERAARAFHDGGLLLFAAAARRRHGELLGGEAGEAEVAEADAWMTAHEVVSPARMTAMLAPGSIDAA